MISLSNFLANVIVTSQASEFVQFRQKVEEKSEEFQFWSALAVIRVEWRELVDPTHSHALTAHSPPFENWMFGIKLNPIMVRSERGESPPENFPQNRWILVNLAHAGRNLVHITFTNEFLWIRHKALSCGPFPTVFDFSFVIPTNQISSHPPPPSFPKTISQIFTVFCFLEASLDYEECPSFSSQENLIDFLPPSFPLCRPVAKTSDVFHPPNLCFTKGKPMFCECPGQCFAPQHLTMQLLLGFAFLSGSTPDKTCGGPLLLLPSARRICHLGHSSRSW